MDNKPTIKLLFQWEDVELGAEPYKPSKSFFVPYVENATVQIEIPLTSGNIANCQGILAMQLSGGTVPDTILTEKGWAAACKKLQSAINGAPEAAVEDFKVDEEEWKDNPIPAAEKEDWEKIDETPEVIPDEKWDNDDRIFNE